MCGVPADLNLERFVGAMLIQIGLGESQIQFHFHPEWGLPSRAGGRGGIGLYVTGQVVAWVLLVRAMKVRPDVPTSKR